MARILRPAPEGHKWCPRCDECKPLSAYTRSKKHALGVYPACRDCKQSEDRAHYSDRQQPYFWQARYGLSKEAYQRLFADQGGICAICEQPETAIHRGKLRDLSVDHDHETGVIRGLLCRACNSALGYFRDDVQVIERALRYLAK